MLLAALTVLAACGGSAPPATGSPDGPAVQQASLPDHPFPDASQLMGLSSQAVSTLLGTPSLKRLDPPAELWQYKDDRCVMNLYLYPPKSGQGSSIVEHFAVTTAESREANRPEGCLYSLITGYDPALRR